VWRHARLVVEVDGHATHGTRFAFEDDRCAICSVWALSLSYSESPRAQIRP
jgi:hypothetical protein